MTATQTQIRRDSAGNLDASVPANGELAYDTTNKALRVGDGVASGGTKMPNAKILQDQSYLSADASGTDTITMTVAPAPPAYLKYQRFVFKAAQTNTASATINVNSLGAKTIKKRTATGVTALDAGDIQQNGVYAVVYDGTDMQLEDAPAATAAGASVDLAGILPWGDHFETAFGAVTASGLAGNSYYSLFGTSATAVKDVSALSNARGVLSLQTGTTSTGFSVASAGGNSSATSTGFSHAAVGAYTFKGKLKLMTISSAAQRYWAALGVSDRPVNALSNGTGTGRAWHCFRYKDDVNGGNWVADSSWNGTSETTNTSVAAITTDFREFEIRVNAANTSVTFYISGDLVATHATNLVPTEQIVVPFAGIAKTVGSTNREILCDYIYALEG